MYRISAINGDTDSEDEDEPQVTKEAEETIAASEYMRALKFMKENRNDAALSLLTELLEAKVIDEVTSEQKKKTLYSVKYNCYKNIAVIYEGFGKKHEALEYYIKAMELDDSDVYTMNKLGQLAFSMEQYAVSQMAFEKCLKKNPNHWPSGDGILRILCQREDYNEAYGWALNWYDKNNKYERGLDVILEIREKFDGFGLNYMENCWSIKFKDKSLKRKNSNSMFPSPSYDEMEPLVAPNIDQFKKNSFDELNWLSLGQLIIRMYEYFKTLETTGINYEFDFDELLLSKEQPTEQVADVEMQEETSNVENAKSSEIIADVNDGSNTVTAEEKQENSNSNAETNRVLSMPLLDVLGTNSGEASADDSDVNAKDTSGSETTSRMKHSRRRGSDLQMLEPWRYWKSNRKFSQRQKNKQNGRNDADTSVNGVLRKILAKYFDENFDNETPFDPDGSTSEPDDAIVTTATTQNGTAESEWKCENFYNDTTESFNELMNELKTSGFCVIKLLFTWPQYISKYWERPMPADLRDVYLQIYRFYLNHYDLNSWVHLNAEDFQTTFCMTLMYLELDHEQALERDDFNANGKNEVNEQWFLLYNHLIFHSGFYDHSPDAVENSKSQKRLNWLQYCLARYEYDLDRAVNYLCTIREVLAQHCDTYRLVFPNRRHNRCIDAATVNSLIVTLERTISLNNVARLYAQNKFDELITILTDSLVHSTNTGKRFLDDEKPVLKITTQIEVILECFWTLERYEECLVWAERSLKYAFDCYEAEPKDSPGQSEWARCVTFILTYVEAVILGESHMIVSCLEKYYSRLIQTIVRILSSQLDTHFDKNNNPLHLIDLKRPWVILHHVLQRNEDLSPNEKRKLSTDSQSSETGTDDEPDENIPKSIMILFTAHDYLGHRSWCTKAQGDLLLFALDVCVPRLRTPFMEPYREIIATYLEQITYCLYGYPAKRARLKHIEEHDAQNIELTWPQAIQLFELYRPDELPEYDDFKTESIPSEMEQLLQRIIAIIPEDIDPSKKCDEMERFIGGKLNELPKALDILPYTVNSIYYLIADYHFKNRDLSKSVKYYVHDLSNCPTRFDSWAGLALAKASLVETKLNSCEVSTEDDMIEQWEEVLMCFNQCLKIDDQAVSLWIEYGNHAYALHSYCSRCLKQSSDTLSMDRFAFLEEKKEQWLKVAANCFTTVDQFEAIEEENGGDGEGENNRDGSHDEKWLYHYMLGKIGEKRKDQPHTIIDHYLQSAKYLYEHNATYPFRIHFTSPQNLSLEALEIFYRITAVVIKYVEQHSTITRAIGKYFMKVLKQLSASPFAMNKAKINENSVNAFKRKLSLAHEEAAKQKMAKLEENAQVTSSQNPTENTSPSTSEAQAIVESSAPVADSTTVTPEASAPPTDVPMEKDSNEAISKPIEVIADTTEPKLTKPATEENVNSPIRRGSQESTATTTTQTTTTTGSDSTDSSTDSSTTDSSSSDSDASSSDDDANKDPNAPMSPGAVEEIYRMCIKNLEECVTRFPEHYKSIYRLVLIYLNAPECIKDVKKCHELFMGTYTTSLNSPIQGLFSDRKPSNLFNGIWRIPSSEIDRPGSFSSHLSKCVHMLMQILRINVDHKLLMELITHLQRVPESDKRCIKDSDRRELLDQAMSFCSQSFKDLAKQYSTDKRDDVELVALILEIYNAHKKCLKNVGQKETVFSAVLVDTYKIFIQDKVARMPDNISYMDLAVKLCNQELNARKNPNAKRLSLDECMAAGSPIRPHNISLPGLNPAIFGSPNTSFNTSIESTSTTPAAKSVTPTPTMTTSTTTTAATTSITSSYANMLPGQPRPRGRPPGSKNINYSTLLPTNSGNAAPLAQLLDPNALSALATLSSNDTFKQTLCQFTDPVQLNAFIMECIRLTSGFSTPSTVTPLPSATPLPQPQQPPPPPRTVTPKPPKTQKRPISPAKSSNVYASNSPVTITPNVPIASSSSSSNIYKSGPSTVISVGSGQLTITPSLSITPNNSQTSVTQSVIPSKQVKPAELKRKSEPNISLSMQPKKMCTDIPQMVKSNLPKSLSIIPSSTTLKAVLNRKPSLPEKSVKTSVPKKKTSLPNLYTDPRYANINFGAAGMSSELFAKYSELIRGTPGTSLSPAPSLASGSSAGFHSQYEQFCSIVASSKPPTSTKPKLTTSGPAPKGMISVKQLETLQDKKPAKSSTAKAVSMYPLPPTAKKARASSTSTGPSMMNPYPTSIAKLTSASYLNPASLLASNSLQISPTKTLQQKLAEKQKALKDANDLTVTVSRPSSASSTGSSKIRQNDSADVIILD